MKFGIYFAYWEDRWDADYLPYLKKVKNLGFDILEISCAGLLSKSLSQLAALRSAAEYYDLTLTAGYGPSFRENLASPDPDAAREAIRFYETLLYRLSLLDIHTIGGGIYSYWPVDYSRPIDKEKDWASAVKNVRAVGRTAADYGISYCLEVLNRFEGYLLNTAREAADFVQQVDVPAVRIMLDTFHMNIEEDSIVDAIAVAGSALGHFHVGENNRRLPGNGGLPWMEIGRALRRAGYDKAVVMEPFVRPGGQVGQDVRLWRDLSSRASCETLDQDAARALQFLKNIF